MGGGNLSPRQKMINMMYLMLTAMLALNVSKEVLDAFTKVDHGLLNAIHSTSEKTQVVYGNFATQNTINPEKVGPFFSKAMEVKNKTEEICNFIYECKKEMVVISEGKDSEAIGEKKIDIDHVSAKDKTEAPAQVMIGSAETKNGKGFTLEKKIDGLREFLLEEIPAMDSSLIREVQTALHTDPQKHADQVHPWVNANFEHLPLAGVITILSAMENDIRNVEADIISHLLDRVTAGSFNFNKLESTIIPSSNHVIKGEKYRAEIFIAASDSMSDPIILMGEYKTTYDKDSIATYEMISVEDTLPVVAGKGILEVPTATIGNKEYSGLIFLQKPTGGYIKRPFKSSYEVAAPSAVVSPTKMNVFFLGVNNPVDISVPGASQSDVIATMTNGSLRKARTGWVAKPRSAASDCKIVVSVKKGNETNRVAVKDFRVELVPDPVALVNNQRGGTIAKNVLAAQRVVIANLPNFFFDLEFRVTYFNLYTTDKGFVRQAESKSNRITSDQRTILQGLSSKQKVFFENVKAVGPDGKTRELGTLSFTIK